MRSVAPSSGSRRAARRAWPGDPAAWRARSSSSRAYRRGEPLTSSGWSRASTRSTCSTPDADYRRGRPAGSWPTPSRTRFAPSVPIRTFGRSLRDAWSCLAPGGGPARTRRTCGPAGDRQTRAGARRLPSKLRIGTLGDGELGHTIAVPARVAVHARVGLPALEQEVQVVLPGEADAAVDLQRRRRHAAPGIG